MTEAFRIISDTTLTYDQQLKALARLGESTDNTLPTSQDYADALKKGIICDLSEGKMPYRPRYIVPDYALFMRKGSAFLGLQPPTNIWEATAALLIMYRYVPSITTFPVYLGNFDELLAPFIQEEAEAKKALRLFLLQIDRTLTDSFVHANIGPQVTIAGRLIMELTKEMQLAIPNITLLYDKDITAESDALLAIDSLLYTAKPSFANHKLFQRDFHKEPYAIASCYNGLLIGGGGFTLPRLLMGSMAKEASSVEDFLNRVLPHYAEVMLENMDRRIAFIVEESAFFKSNFLVKEGFLHLDKFVGLAGMVGIAECVNTLCHVSDPLKGYGHDEKLDDVGVQIMTRLESLVNDHKTKYCAAFDHHHILHAQVGIETDGRDNSPGCRIPIYAEPDIVTQTQHAARFHKFFPSGAGEIFKFDDTWKRSPLAILDIIQGAFESDLRYFSGYLADCDVVRVTGYLVKKSELHKLDQGEQSINQVSLFGQGARDGARALDRKVQHVSTDQ